MQLVTRLLLRLFAVGFFMLILVALFTLFAARHDIADEVRSSQSIGQLITTLSELQGSDSLDRQHRRPASRSSYRHGRTLRAFA